MAVHPTTRNPAGHSPAPARDRSTRLIIGIGVAQLGIFIAILAPVMVSMQLKAQALSPEDPAGVLATVLPVGALGAIIGNPVFGALSDRTRTRWGRRRPWMVGGIIALALGLVGIALAPTVPTLLAAWLFCQLASNASSSALMASFADNVPALRRGRAASVLGFAQNLSILVGTYAAALLVDHLTLLFVLPGVLGVAMVLWYASFAPDDLPERRPAPFSAMTLLRSFWTNPLKHPDFALAWWSRFLIILATYLFTTFRLLYMQDHLGLSTAEAVSSIATGVLLYTLALLAGTLGSGWLSDRLGRRKIFVAGSTALFGAGLVALVFADSVGHFYLAEIIMGLAYGVYVAIDYALVIDVLPDPDQSGKDLGVLNIANSLPQSFAPPIGALLLSLGGGGNYEALLWTAGAVAAVGALAVLPIRGVR